MHMLSPPQHRKKPKGKPKRFGSHPTYLVQRDTGRTQNEPIGERFQLFSSDLGGLAVATVIFFFGWNTPGLNLQVFQSPDALQELDT